jgi:hypothetical protein
LLQGYVIKATQQIEGQMVQLIEHYGEWTYDIPLTHDIWFVVSAPDG